MDRNYIKKILETKSKPELQRLSIDLNVDYKGLTKKNIVSKILLAPKKQLQRYIPELQKSRITKSNYFRIIIVVIPILIGIFTTRYCSMNKEDVKNALSESNKESQKVYLENEEYKSKIDEYKSLNSSFLEKLLPFGYYVFGYRDEQFVVLDEYIEDSSLLDMDDLIIKLNFEKKYGEIVYLDLSECRLFKVHINIKQTLIMNAAFRLAEIGEFTRIPSLNINYVGFYFVLLNEDTYNPIFVLGFGNIDYLSGAKFDPNY